MSKPLAVIPNYVTQAADTVMLETCLSTLRDTVGGACDVIVVDDGSPENDLVRTCRGITEAFDGRFVAKPHNEGFSRTVNVGLRKAVSEERDAILINADIEFTTKTWLSLMLSQRTSDGEKPASIVGALLLYPNGLIQHAGVYFSLLYRHFDHIHRYGPGNLPEAQNARVCPVTGALQFIRYECLVDLGVYDETFKMGWEDVDYCVRAWQSGREVIYQPGVRAIHHESFFRGRRSQKVEKWTHESWLRFCAKWGTLSFAEFVPMLTLGEEELDAVSG